MTEAELVHNLLMLLYIYNLLETPAVIAWPSLLQDTMSLVLCLKSLMAESHCADSLSDFLVSWVSGSRRQGDWVSESLRGDRVTGGLSAIHKGQTAQCEHLPLMLIPSSVYLLSPAPYFTAQRLYIQLPLTVSAEQPPDPITQHHCKTITRFNNGRHYTPSG